MKLWLCGAVTTDSDCAELVVAESEEKAKEKYKKSLEGIWYASIYVDEINELDGYEIIVREKRHYASGSNYYN